MVLAVVSILVTGGETAGYRTWHQQSGAMEPTYPEGSDVTVKPIDGSGVRRGDVVLFSGRLFLLGDHRVAAADSRAHLSENSGTIARSAVVGMAVDPASVPPPFLRQRGAAQVLRHALDECGESVR